MMGPEKFVDVDGIRTRYFEGGAGEPMLLLHGGNFGDSDNVDCAENWDLNWDGLCRKFHVFAVDRLGQGYTDNPSEENYRVEAIIAHLRGFIASQNLDGLNLIGHSRGGYMAMRLACEDQGRMKSLTVVDSSTAGSGVNIFRGPLLADAPRPLLTRESIAWVTRRFSFSDKLLTDNWMAARAAIARTPKNAEAVRKFGELRPRFEAGLQAQKDATLDWIRAGNLTLPTLLVWGKNDPSAVLQRGLDLFDVICQPAAVAHMHIFNQAGHYAYREHPDSFVEVVTGFINSNAR